MKKIMSLLMAAALLAAALAGCGSGGASSTPARETAAESFGVSAESVPPETSETAAPSAEAPAETAAPEEGLAEEDAAQASTAEDASDGSRVLVLYFSAADNDGIDAVASATATDYEGGEYGAAQLLAQWIADYTGGDLSAILTAESYPDDYDAMADMAKEQADNDEHPALRSHVDNFD